LDNVLVAKRLESMADRGEGVLPVAVKVAGQQQEPVPSRLYNHLERGTAPQEQDEADLAAGSHIVPGSNSIRRDTITHLGTLITNLSKTSPEYGAGAIIGFKFSEDEKKINKLREHAWLKWPCIIDVYKILIEWFKDRKQVEHPRLNMAYPEMKLKTLSRTNGLVRDASIAGVDGSHVWGMFLRQEWKKLADYNAADAQETLALFLRRNLYVKARESFKDTGEPMFYKVNMHKAAMYMYGNNEKIKQILQHTDTLRAEIERTEMRLGMHFNPAHNGIHPAHVTLPRQLV
jgi:hypothetical protein